MGTRNLYQMVEKHECGYEAKKDKVEKLKNENLMINFQKYLGKRIKEVKIRYKIRLSDLERPKKHVSCGCHSGE